MGGQNWQVCSLLFLAVCVPLATSLTRECSSVRTPCILQYNIDQDFSMDPCVTASRYVQCLVNVLVPARQGGTCSPVAALTYFYDLYKESKVYTQFCSSFVIPSSLELDECQKEIAVCGRFSSDAFIARDSANNVTLCRSNAASFTTCMDSETRSCSDRAQIAQYRQLDLAEMACDSITTTTTRMTTTTPTTTTTTRSPTTATTTTPSTTSTRPTTTTTTTTTTTSRPTTATTTTRPITTLLTTTTARPINGVYTNPCASETVRNGSMMYFPDATDRTRFWHCTPWGGAYLMGCGQGTRWNQVYLACVWA